MKKYFKSLLATLCALALFVPVLAACDKEDSFVETDYVSQLQLDMTSGTKKQEVKVRLYIDGDTTHFDPIGSYDKADFAKTDGYIKARYLAINTPESTGKIEKWGKSASNFTHEKLVGAESIIVESDDGNWNIDSTGERYTLWIWYKPAGAAEYRNLNLEIAQAGFALPNAVTASRYGDIVQKAFDQARTLQLHVYSPASTVDENYFGENATELTLKELRCHVGDYLQKPVRVEGVVVAVYDETAYIEELDAESGEYFGMQVYYGFAKDSVPNVLSVGNRVSVWGTVSLFPADSTLETGTVQISGVEHNDYRPDSKKNTNILGEEGAYAPAFIETSAKDLVSGKRTVLFENDEAEDGIEKVTLPYGEAVLGTSVTLSDLFVESVYTTQSGASKNAMTLHCTAADGTQITIRTEVLTDENGLVTAERYNQKTITVKGIVGKYEGEYQVNVHRADYITIVE